MSVYTPQLTDIQDRTLEFQQCVASFNRLNKTKPSPAANAPPKKSEFSLRASAVATDIAHTLGMLSKLAMLVKKKPLFDDKPVEIAQLTNVIKQDIFRIERALKDLLVFTKGGAEPQAATHSKNVVQILSTQFKNISGDFKTVLETRQRNEQLNKSRQEQFLSAVSSNVVAGSATTSENPFMALDNPFLSRSATPFADTDTSPYGDYLTLPDQSQQLMLMEEQSVYLQDRNRAVETIESTINEVGNLFQQLATMVSEQGETIQRIDTNVEDISMNIQGAQRELLKYYAHISSNRFFFLKIFAVIMVFFMCWVLVS
ncbi:hypothetical protein BABINDRAFT_37140 [Babjeviella inositovora NRRL Y-12698]|uniref:t-SNARE coiled-coil homology domain-containing protein n=1 Tax=Babjeviella inositovora NRRL Y-12698 TaxID=984486 RepID=A0A1E3QRC0_9ASCO|nr:uncharacterized protein BABINDRAFT_37140 [Babjeviella inositovora NRRL Y-12698]ODQ79602.1 hypothetical protein BABINDRAFT_37140 [Babjeviella inositovora NRRL Y-12698]